MSGRTTRNVSTAGFVVDPNSIDRSSGRQIDWANVPESKREVPGTDPVLVTVDVAGAAGNAVAVPVTALPGAIPSGTMLHFGAKKFAILTADAAAGAVALAVEALPTALVGGDTAIYAGVKGQGNKVLRAGTAVGELLGGGKISPRVAATNPAVGLLETDAVENDVVASKTGYGMIVGGVVYENLLPDSAGGPPRVLAAGIKNELNTAGVSKGFLFQQYLDNRS